MVDHVLSDNSGHRRFLFEEASGITKYKARKQRGALQAGRHRGRPHAAQRHRVRDRARAALAGAPGRQGPPLPAAARRRCADARPARSPPATCAALRSARDRRARALAGGGGAPRGRDRGARRARGAGSTTRSWCCSSASASCRSPRAALRDREEARGQAEHQVVLLRRARRGPRAARADEAGRRGRAACASGWPRSACASRRRRPGWPSCARARDRGVRHAGGRTGADGRATPSCASIAPIAASRQQLSLDLFSTEAERRGACERIRERQTSLRERREAAGAPAARAGDAAGRARAPSLEGGEPDGARASRPRWTRRAARWPGPSRRSRRRRRACRQPTAALSQGAAGCRGRRVAARTRCSSSSAPTRASRKA